MTTPLSLSVGKLLAAVGMSPRGGTSNGAQAGIWEDRRLAFGLTHLLAESLYGTGKFRLVEEQDSRQHQLLAELVDLFANVSRPQPSASELVGIGARLDADLLAYGRIGYTRSSGRRVHIGPFGHYQQELRVTVEVCLLEVASQRTLCREGEGSARQEGLGVVYEFRNDRPDLERNAIGRATKQAVVAAVQVLMASILFAPE